MKLAMFRRWRADAVNLTALTCLQASNAVIPLLIVPFAIARLGAASYADIAITEAISVIAVAAVLYSFEVDGVSRISDLRLANHREELSVVLSGILLARLLIFVGIATVLLTITIVFTSLEPALLACWLLVPLGHVFHSYWFYQGVEFNIPPAVLTFLARISSLAIVATCVHSSEDQVRVPLAIGAPFAIAGIASTIYKARILGVKIRWIGLRPILNNLVDGRQIFVGTAAVMLYRELNVLLMGLAGVPAAAISSYSLVEKSVKMIQAVTRPLSQIAFPKVLRALREHRQPDRGAALVVLRYTTPQIALAAALIIAPLLGFDRLAARFPSLTPFGALPDVGLLFAIMAPAPLFGLANFMFGSAGLNQLNAQGYLLRAILLTGSLSLAACLLLSTHFGAVGSAASFVGAEIVLFVLIINRYRINSYVMNGNRER